MSKKQGRGKGLAGIDLGGLWKGLGDLVENLSELAEKGAELERTGNLKTKDGLEGIYGVRVKVGGLGGKEGVRVEPFGNVKRDDAEGSSVLDEREPIVDLLDEEDHVLVIAELPGVSDDVIETELSGDVLVIRAAGENRKYRKDVQLPCSFEPSVLSRRLENGILQVRLDKTT